MLHQSILVVIKMNLLAVMHRSLVTSLHVCILYRAGGKILVRFETPAHRFLFPEVPPTKGELQQVELDKSRKYQVSYKYIVTCQRINLSTVGWLVLSNFPAIRYLVWPARPIPSLPFYILWFMSI